MSTLIFLLGRSIHVCHGQSRLETKERGYYYREAKEVERMDKNICMYMYTHSSMMRHLEKSIVIICNRGPPLINSKQKGKGTHTAVGGAAEMM